MVVFGFLKLVDRLYGYVKTYPIMFRLVRENFIAGLQSYSHEVITANTEAYNKQVKESVEAGKPIIQNDMINLDNARNKAVLASLDTTTPVTAPVAELVTA